MSHVLSKIIVLNISINKLYKFICVNIYWILSNSYTIFLYSVQLSYRESQDHKMRKR